MTIVLQITLMSRLHTEMCSLLLWNLVTIAYIQLSISEMLKHKKR